MSPAPMIDRQWPLWFALAIAAGAAAPVGLGAGAPGQVQKGGPTLPPHTRVLHLVLDASRHALDVVIQDRQSNRQIEVVHSETASFESDPAIDPDHKRAFEDWVAALHPVGSRIVQHHTLRLRARDRGQDTEWLWTFYYHDFKFSSDLAWVGSRARVDPQEATRCAEIPPVRPWGKGSDHREIFLRLGTLYDAKRRAGQFCGTKGDQLKLAWRLVVPGSMLGDTPWVALVERFSQWASTLGPTLGLDHRGRPVRYSHVDLRFTDGRDVREYTLYYASSFEHGCTRGGKLCGYVAGPRLTTGKTSAAQSVPGPGPGEPPGGAQGVEAATVPGAGQGTTGGGADPFAVGVTRQGTGSASEREEISPPLGGAPGSPSAGGTPSGPPASEGPGTEVAVLRSPEAAPGDLASRAGTPPASPPPETVPVGEATLPFGRLRVAVETNPAGQIEWRIDFRPGEIAGSAETIDITDLVEVVGYVNSMLEVQERARRSGLASHTSIDLRSPGWGTAPADEEAWREVVPILSPWDALADGVRPSGAGR